MRDLEITSTPFAMLDVGKYVSSVRKGEENGGFLNRGLEPSGDGNEVPGDGPLNSSITKTFLTNVVVLSYLSYPVKVSRYHTMYTYVTLHIQFFLSETKCTHLKCPTCQQL